MTADHEERTGGVSFDIVRAMFERLGPRGGTGRREADAALLLAELVVQARCAQLGVRVPQRAELHCASWAQDGDGYTFCLNTNELAARVLIPAGELNGRHLPVRLQAR